MVDSSSDYCDYGDDDISSNDNSTAKEEENEDLSVDESESSNKSYDEHSSESEDITNSDTDDDDSTVGVSNDVLTLLTGKLPKFVKKIKDERKKYVRSKKVGKKDRKNEKISVDWLKAQPMYIKASKQLNGKGGQKEIDKIINGGVTGKATGINIDTDNDINTNNKNNNDSNYNINNNNNSNNKSNNDSGTGVTLETVNETASTTMNTTNTNISEVDDDTNTNTAKVRLIKDYGNGLNRVGEECFFIHNGKTYKIMQMLNNGHCGALALAYGTIQLGFGHILFETNTDETKTGIDWMVRNIIYNEYKYYDIDDRYSQFLSEDDDKTLMEHANDIKNTNFYLGEMDIIAYANATGIDCEIKTIYDNHTALHKRTNISDDNDVLDLHGTYNRHGYITTEKKITIVHNNINHFDLAIPYGDNANNINGISRNDDDADDDDDNDDNDSGDNNNVSGDSGDSSDIGNGGNGGKGDNGDNGDSSDDDDDDDDGADRIIRPRRQAGQSLTAPPVYNEIELGMKSYIPGQDYDLFEEDDKYNMPSSTFTTPTKPSQQSLTTSFTNEDSDNGDNVNSPPFLSEESPINSMSSPTHPPTPNRILSLSKTKDIGRKDKTRKTNDHTTPRRLLSKNVEDEQNLEEKTLEHNDHPKLFNLGSVVLDERFRRVDQPRPRSRPGPDTNDDTAELFVNDRSTATSSSSSFPSPSSSSLNALGDIFSSSDESSVDVVTKNTSRIRQNRRVTTYSRRNTRDT